MELFASFLGACLFTYFISGGIGKRFADHPVGRVLMGALGFLIVIAGFSYGRRDFELFKDLVASFMLVCSPVLFKGAYDALVQRDQDKAQHKSELEKKDLDHYSVKQQPRVFGGVDDEEFDPYGVTSADEHS